MLAPTKYKKKGKKMKTLAVPTGLAQALLNYLNSKPRAETNTLATALEKLAIEQGLVKNAQEEVKEEAPAQEEAVS
jgi:hypothetical protein